MHMKKFLMVFLMVLSLATVSYGASVDVTWDGVAYTCTPSSTPPGEAYTVSVNVVNATGGTVTPISNTGIPSGGMATFKVVVKSGYSVSLSEGTLSGTTWTTAAVTANRTVTATFVKLASLGSKTNPIPMNQKQVTPRPTYIYYPSTADQNQFQMPSGKVYFLVDSAVTGVAISKFIYTVQGFNNPNFIFTKMPQTKAGVDLLPEEVNIGNNTGDTADQVTNKTPYNFTTTRWLYAIDNPGPEWPTNVTIQFMQ
jgi:hypothetical protein